VETSSVSRVGVERPLIFVCSNFLSVFAGSTLHCYMIGCRGQRSYFVAVFFFFLRRCTGNIVPFKNNWQNAFALPPRNISQWLQTQFRSWVVVKLVQNITVVQINEEIRVRRRAKEFQKQSCRGTHCSNGESGRKLSIIQNKKKSSVLQRLEELLRRFQAIARYFLMLERSVCLLQMGYAILHRTYVAEVGRGVGSQLWRRV
jgi:hypothetical protein